jgi:hypothetical protein
LPPSGERNLQAGTLAFVAKFMKKLICCGKFVFVMCFGLAFFGCQTAKVTNTNANLPANTNSSNVSPNQTPLPPEFSATPLPLSGATPGIPDATNANVQSSPKKATPTPGIPASNKINPAKIPSGTPTPGIPDMNKINKSSNQNSANSNAAAGQLPSKSANFNKNQ